MILFGGVSHRAMIRIHESWSDLCIDNKIILQVIFSDFLNQTKFISLLIDLNKYNFTVDIIYQKIR